MPLLVAVVLGFPLSSAFGQGDVRVVVYDVTDLVKVTPDFPAPKLGLSGLSDEAEATPVFEFDDEDKRGPLWTTEQLVELIKEMVLPDSWDDSGVSIVAGRGVIIIAHHGRGHGGIAHALHRLNREYEIEGRWIAGDDEALASLGFDPDGPDAQVLPRKEAQKALKRLARSQKVELIGRASHRTREAQPVRVRKCGASGSLLAEMRIRSSEKRGQIEIESPQLRDSTAKPAKEEQAAEVETSALSPDAVQTAGAVDNREVSECSPEKKVDAESVRTLSPRKSIVVIRAKHDGREAFLLLRVRTK